MNRERLRRLGWALLLAMALAPGTWLRDGPIPPDRSGTLKITPLAPDSGQSSASGLAVKGIWELSSSDRRFGGYSALIVAEGGRLRAFSDFGTWLEFHAPDEGHKAAARFGDVRSPGSKPFNDVESAARDPQSGTIWLGLEFANSIRRLSRDGGEMREVRPTIMAGLANNGGIESMARLADGRFVLLVESAEWNHTGQRKGLLYASDPVEGAEAVEFLFEPPAGFDPVDAATLPDGRVLILLRAMSFSGFPFFASRLVVADPARIMQGQPWPWRQVADLTKLAPRENYEGLAVLPRQHGLTLWLVSDANTSVTQRTLLLELEWRETTRP